MLVAVFSFFPDEYKKYSRDHSLILKNSDFSWPFSC